MIDNLIQEGIISAENIDALQNMAEQSNRRVVFIDATFTLPTSTEDIRQNFIDMRLPNAALFDIKKIKDNTSPLPHMLPSHKVFATAVSAMGIRNNDIIVTYGQHGMIMGPARAWWMFRGFGHTNVLVLNGGLPAWQKGAFKTQSGQPSPVPPAQYTAQPFKTTMLSNINDVMNASEDKVCPILDARRPARFNGSAAEPRAGMRSGHIPNSINTPAKSFVNEHGLMKSKNDVKQIIQNTGIDVRKNTQRIIVSCGSGITACALSLALHYIGHDNVSVYDGSWSEWGLKSSETEVLTIKSS